jgi:peptidoglycan-associated lipoprotein
LSHSIQTIFKTQITFKEDVMMNRKFLLLTLIVSLGVFVFWGCPKKAEMSSAPETKQEAAPAAGANGEKMATANETAKPGAKDEAMERAAKGAEGLQPIYFDFDRSFVRSDAKDVMKANADWLKANPKVKVRIEGNCDERGTKEYNQALGQRRAAAAKKYLTDLGISAKRISLISYGKEKPVCTDATESCWQKNRRDDFVAAE